MTMGMLVVCQVVTGWQQQPQPFGSQCTAVQRVSGVTEWRGVAGCPRVGQWVWGMVWCVGPAEITGTVVCRGLMW